VQVDFEGAYAIEGAKEVSTVMTRHVSRLLRPWLLERTQDESLQVRCVDVERDISNIDCLKFGHALTGQSDVQERRRQTTVRFKQYFATAVSSSSRAVSSFLKGSAVQGTVYPQQSEREVPEHDVTLRLLLTKGGNALALEQT
jgi:hypothetical protein